MLDFFSSKKDKKHHDYFKLLVAIAHKDGNLDKSEVAVLCNIGNRLGLGTNLIQELINGHREHYIMELPTEPGQKFDQLFDLISIMLADNKILDEEVDFCVRIATKMNFNPHIVGTLVRRILMGIEHGDDKETIKNEALAFLHH